MENSLEGHPGLDDIKEKIPELGRPPLWSVLRKLLDHYGVPWKDVYPPETEKPTFISVRNKLLHTAESVDLPTLFYETDRLQVVLERLLLSLLNWDDAFGAASVSEAERLAAGPSSGNVEVWD